MEYTRSLKIAVNVKTQKVIKKKDFWECFYLLLFSIWQLVDGLFKFEKWSQYLRKYENTAKYGKRRIA